MAACPHVRRVGSEANVDKSRKQAFRPPYGGDLGERRDKCPDNRHDKRHDKRDDIGGYRRRTYPELLWRPEDVLRVQLGRTLCRRYARL